MSIYLNVTLLQEYYLLRDRFGRKMTFHSVLGLGP
jgi:hypothetical protein